jgi:SpoIID/LytB domain protein
MRNPVLRNHAPRTPASILPRPRRRARVAGTAALLTLLLAGLPAVRGVAATVGGPPPEEHGDPADMWSFRGGGWGHGVGMSQYGALGMALKGRSAADIVAFYYGGARIARTDVPSTIRVGLLQDRADGIVLRQERVPGAAPGGRLRVTALHSDTGKPLVRSFEHGRDLRVVPERGGLSVLNGEQRVLGPGMAGASLTVDYALGQGGPVLLTLPQVGRTLRWGRVEVASVGDGTATRLRAVATMAWTSYLRGLAEVPASWPAEALRAQAVTARSYALATVRASGQHRAASSRTGCDCAVHADVRDQHFAGWARERGPGAERWRRAVADTRDKVVMWQGGTLVKAFYSSSNGGHTASSEIWGGPARPYYPSKIDPNDAADGRNPYHAWNEQRTQAAVSTALADLGLGEITAVEPVTRDESDRLKTVFVAGTSGSTLISGQFLKQRLKLRSTRLLSVSSPQPAGERPYEDEPPETPDDPGLHIPVPSLPTITLPLVTPPPSAPGDGPRSTRRVPPPGKRDEHADHDQDSEPRPRTKRDQRDHDHTGREQRDSERGEPDGRKGTRPEPDG